MINIFKSATAYKLLPKREVNSHKGENGKVMIVGGSLDYFGAPILAGLGALYSGADLVYLYVPECNFEVTRGMYPDFIVKKFKGEFLTKESALEIVEFGKNMDSILMGPGLSNHEKTVEAVVEIINNLHVPTVLDADAITALKKMEKFPMDQQMVITPHANEFENLVDRDIIVKEEDPKSVILLRSIAMDLHINVLLKGHIDYVSSEEGVVDKNLTGNAGMTVGGSGDVLAGVVASFLAQKMEGFDAARCAAFFCGKAGDLLFKQKGFYYSASDIAMSLPYALK
jgi:NAD(P)H-hydrate epimerase